MKYGVFRTYCNFFNYCIFFTASIIQTSSATNLDALFSVPSLSAGTPFSS